MKNEEKYIQRCLESVKTIVDEIVVVDTGSVDNTLQILGEMKGVKLFRFNWVNDFSIARNFSIEKTTGDYILVLDADEYVIEGNRAELEKIMAKNSIGRLTQANHFVKNGGNFESKINISRFFPRDVRYVGAIHEQINSTKPRFDMNFIVKHDGYFETNKSDRNIPLLLEEVKKNPIDSYYLYQLGKELRMNEDFNNSIHFLKKSYTLTKKSEPFYDDLVLELINCGKEIGDKDILKIINDNELTLKNVTDYHFAKGMFYMDYCLKNIETAAPLLVEIERSFLTCLTLANGNYIEYVKGTSSFLASFNLGVFYEVTGNLEEAKKYYQKSVQLGYGPAKLRLSTIQ